MEYINNCSDLEVKNALDKTNFATKITKVKSIKQGQSHCEGEVSNSIDFRDTRSEVFLFDTGAGVSIIGEAIAKDNKIKVYKLKTPRKIVEASGNELNIIGSCEIYCKIPIIDTIKKLKCLVLRGNYVDHEILVSCETQKNGILYTPHLVKKLSLIISTVVKLIVI